MLATRCTEQLTGSRLHTEPTCTQPPTSRPRTQRATTSRAQCSATRPPTPPQLAPHQATFSQPPVTVCVSQLSSTVTTGHAENSLEGTRLFWLTVFRPSVHSRLTP